ncbi:putative membrane protein [Chlamydia psittaci 04DC42]|uniref:hypothetical protein n=1 Tax=Chlamydia psittaci TaxID=83554 RepID=UPI0003547FB7|nr:hypothetical protein [Chlamydia psittaci]EPJ22689.1 putative membrane protein [Chlamydia psittaci 04DC42]
MTQSFDVLSQNAFKKIFNKQRFLFIFSSLCCFGFVFSIFLKLCSQFVLSFSLSTLGLGAFFSFFSIVCASAVVVQALLKQESVGNVEKITATFHKNWKSLWLSLLVSMPFFIAMVVVSTIILLSMFLSSLPWIGRVFHTLLIFVPYLSATTLILLFLGSFISLFFCIPVLSDHESVDYMQLLSCFKGNVLKQSIGFIIAATPLALCSWLALDSFYLMSHLVCLSDMNTGSFLMEVLVLVMPIALILTPALSFFLNFSFDFYLMKQTSQDNLIKE